MKKSLNKLIYSQKYIFILVITKSCILKKLIYNFNYKTASIQYEICQTIGFQKAQVYSSINYIHGYQMSDVLLLYINNDKAKNSN